MIWIDNNTLCVVAPLLHPVWRMNWRQNVEPYLDVAVMLVIAPDVVLLVPSQVVTHLGSGVPAHTCN